MQGISDDLDIEMKLILPICEKAGFGRDDFGVSFSVQKKSKDQFG